MALKTTDPPLQKVVGPPAVIVAVGNAFTVITRVYCVFKLSLYLIVSVPADTPVTITEFVVEFETVAIDVFEETHGFEAAGVPLPVNVIVDPTQTVVEPVI